MISQQILDEFSRNFYKLWTLIQQTIDYILVSDLDLGPGIFFDFV